jgi:tungstate transport system substrate-binding protein
MVRRRTVLAGALALPSLARAGTEGQAHALVLASTTSPEHSGLLAHLLPPFEAAAGIAVRVVALGTGQALDLARRGEADAVLTHDREAEERFVSEGHGLSRHPVMYNDFVLLGAVTDAARIGGLSDTAEALRRIALARAPFVSRGDRSGTQLVERRLWREAGMDPLAGRGAWYREVGQGMGPALRTAAAQDAYILSDRATWLALREPRDLRVLVQGDERMFNQYAVAAVNPARHPAVRAAAAQRFVDWIVSAEGQRAIARFRVEGQPAFFPNAGRVGA